VYFPIRLMIKYHDGNPNPEIEMLQLQPAMQLAVARYPRIYAARGENFRLFWKRRHQL
jgi:hypothetical protein